MSNPYNEHFKKIKNKKSTPTGNYSQTKLSMKKKKVKLPIMSVVFLIVSIGLLSWGYMNMDRVENYLGRLDVTFFSTALGKEETATPNVTNTENSAASTNGKAAAECPDPRSYTSEEANHFSKLSERKKQLDLRETELNALEEELHKQREEVESRIVQLDKIRSEIGVVLKERVDVDEERVTKLVDFYSNMKPKQAAEIFNDLNENLAVEVLGRMKKKNAAEIMNLLEPKKAQVLSEKFTGYKRR